MEEETKYKIETTDKREMELMLNATKMSLALYEIMCWRREIYNNKDYDISVIYKDKKYTGSEWFKKELPKEDYEEDGFTLKEKPMYCYTDDDIIKKLDELLYDTESFIRGIYE